MIALATANQPALGRGLNSRIRARMRTTFYRLLPARWRGSATPERVALATQFIRFAAVGLAGLVVDTATV